MSINIDFGGSLPAVIDNDFSALVHTTMQLPVVVVKEWTLEC